MLDLNNISYICGYDSRLCFDLDARSITKGKFKMRSFLSPWSCHNSLQPWYFTQYSCQWPKGVSSDDSRSYLQGHMSKCTHSLNLCIGRNSLQLHWIWIIFIHLRRLIMTRKSADTIKKTIINDAWLKHYSTCILMKSYTLCIKLWAAVLT